MSERLDLVRLALGACALLMTPFAQAAESAESLLKRADAYRLAADSVKVETRIEVLKNGQLDKERRYTVMARPGRESLVLMRSPAEKGQKVLMKGDDFWMIMPTSQRPIRITPTQKLLGDAAAGDVATLSWSTDYSATLAGEDKCGDLACQHLSLKARYPSTTYARIELWVDAKSAQPLRAELYVASEKLAKRAEYTTKKVDGAMRVVSMAIDDEIATGRRTVLHYESTAPAQPPEEWFNPMFLTRNEVQP